MRLIRRPGEPVQPDARRMAFIGAPSSMAAKTAIVPFAVRGDPGAAASSAVAFVGPGAPVGQGH